MILLLPLPGVDNLGTGDDFEAQAHGTCRAAMEEPEAQSFAWQNNEPCAPKWQTAGLCVGHTAAGRFSKD